MKFHILDDNSTIEKVKNGEKYIDIDLQIAEEDYVIINNTFFEYSSCYSRIGECVIRKCDEIDSVSNAEITILKALMTTYKEISDINNTLTAFSNLTTEELYKSLSELLACVKRHGKITEKEALFLFDVLSGSKTKKQLMGENICTYDELNSAYGKFVDEMQWCYGYKKPYIENRAKAFFNGDIEFLWNPSTFLAEYSIDKTILGNVLKNILRSNKLVDDSERRSLVPLLQKYLSKTELNLKQRIELSELCKKIVVRFECEIEFLYLGIAQKLINDNKTHIKDIVACARQTGYCEHLISFAMRKLGVKPNHHIRRRTELLRKFLEDDDVVTTKKKRKIFIVSGPSGSGKTTIFAEAIKAFPSIVRTISDTTRNPREGEKNGVDYNFVSAEEFKNRLFKRGYIEHTFYDNNYYGTRREYFHPSNKNDIALIIDVNGAECIKRRFDDAITIFILPPSVEELQKRLISRGCNTAEEIEHRLQKAKKEIEKSSSFDHIVINENIDNAIKEVVNIISSNMQ